MTLRALKRVGLGLAVLKRLERYKNFRDRFMTLAIMKRFGSKPSHDRTSAGPGAKEAVVEGTRVLSRSPHLGRLKIQ